MSANLRSRGKKAAATAKDEDPVTSASEEAAAEAGPAKVNTPDKYIQLFDKAGQVLYTSNVLKSTDFYRSTRDNHLIEHLPSIIRRAQGDLEDFDTHNLNLSQTSLAGIDFQGIVLNGADLSNCNFNGADLRGAQLRGCDLTDAAFDSSRMNNCDVTGANLTDTSFSHVEAREIVGVIMLCELDDFFMYGYRDANEVTRIRCGCRDFDIPGAHEHWDRAPGRSEIRAGVALIEAVAKNRGWKLTADQAPPEKQEPEPRPVADDFEDDDE